MADDLVAATRARIPFYVQQGGHHRAAELTGLCDRIEALEKQVRDRPTDPLMDEVWEVLRPFADLAYYYSKQEDDAPVDGLMKPSVGMCRRARALLSKLEGHGG